jgi:hypothetical protein
MSEERVNLTCILGAEIERIDGLFIGSDRVAIFMKNGSEYIIFHHQHCCETSLVKDFNCSEVFEDGNIITGINFKHLEGDADWSDDDDDDEYFYWDSNKSSCEQFGSHKKVRQINNTVYEIYTSCGDIVIEWEGKSNGLFHTFTNLHYLSK